MILLIVFMSLFIYVIFAALFSRLAENHWGDDGHGGLVFLFSVLWPVFILFIMVYAPLAFIYKSFHDDPRDRWKF